MGEPPCFANLLDEEGHLPEPAQVRIRRVYDDRPRPDEIRVLVDRIWPRGVAKSKLKPDRWARELAPSPELRRWFGHDPERWPEFRRRYKFELAEHAPELLELARLARQGRLVLLYSARDEKRNQAAVLQEVLEEALS